MPHRTAMLDSAGPIQMYHRFLQAPVCKKEWHHLPSCMARKCGSHSSLLRSTLPLNSGLLSFTLTVVEHPLFSSCSVGLPGFPLTLTSFLVILQICTPHASIHWTAIQMTAEMASTGADRWESSPSHRDRKNPRSSFKTAQWDSKYDHWNFADIWLKCYLLTGSAGLYS